MALDLLYNTLTIKSRGDWRGIFTLYLCVERGITGCGVVKVRYLELFVRTIYRRYKLTMKQTVKNGLE